MAPGDEEMLRWVKDLNKFDLYTKVSRAVRDVTMISPIEYLVGLGRLICSRLSTYTVIGQDEGNPLDVEALWPYYQALIDKYLPAGPLRW